MTKRTILVTGGLGFVGSHFVWEAVRAGARVVVLDDRSAGTEPPLPDEVETVIGCIGDAGLVGAMLGRYAPSDVVHFAGRIAVGESVRDPALYFDVNVVRAFRLLESVVAAGVENFVFSSSAAVYGEPETVPISETARTEPVNPYGATKLGFEHMLAAFAGSHGLRWAALRYFNAAGAHPNGQLVEAHDPETHLIPLALDAALGVCEPVTVFGDDYRTPDGTCIRDYVHVCDLADGHLLALERLHAGACPGPINLGTGKGHSVREVLETAAAVLGAPVPHRVGKRRSGDPRSLVADASRAREVLAWEPRRGDLHTIIEDALRPRRG